MTLHPCINQLEVRNQKPWQPPPKQCRRKAVPQYLITQAPHCEGFSSLSNIRQERQVLPPTSHFCVGRRHSNFLRALLRETHGANILTLSHRQPSNSDSNFSYNMNGNNQATSLFYHWEYQRPLNSDRSPTPDPQYLQGFQPRNIDLRTPAWPPLGPPCIYSPTPLTPHQATHN